MCARTRVVRAGRSCEGGQKLQLFPNLGGVKNYGSASLNKNYSRFRRFERRVVQLLGEASAGQAGFERGRQKLRNSFPAFLFFFSRGPSLVPRTGQAFKTGPPTISPRIEEKLKEQFFPPKPNECIFSIEIYDFFTIFFVRQLSLRSTDLKSERKNRGRCYDQNFRRFLTVFDEKTAHLSNINEMVKFFAKSSNRFRKTRQLFGQKILIT
jgi:hypothetical protein